MRKKQKEAESKRRDAIYGPDFEDEGRHCEPSSRALYVGKGKTQILSWSLQRKLSLDSSLFCVLEATFQISGCQNCKRIHLCCFKTASLW